MRYFIDAEFNGFDGDLVALAAVPEDNSALPFYEAVVCSRPTEWVSRHVLPVLQTKPLQYHEVAQVFSAFLASDHSPLLVADWPDDIAHAARLLTNGRGRRLLTSRARFELLNASDFSAESASQTPHNAYYDALSLRSWVLANEMV